MTHEYGQNGSHPTGKPPSANVTRQRRQLPSVFSKQLRADNGNEW
jgi:hypothetical protein